jgi:hypothetical protein
MRWSAWRRRHQAAPADATTSGDVNGVAGSASGSCGVPMQGAPRGDSALVDGAQPARMPFDAEQYIRRSPEGPVFRRSILAGHRDSPRHDVYEYAGAIAFLARWPVLLGRCPAAPKRHVEHWVDDLDKNEFVDLQRVVHRVARALAASVRSGQLEGGRDRARTRLPT